MSKFNAVTGEFYDENVPNSNVSENAGAPLPQMTGEGDFPPGAELVGPEVMDHPGWYYAGYDVPKFRLQAGRTISIGQQGYVLVVNPDAPGMHWEKVAE